MRNFEVFSVRENGGFFADFEVPEDGSGARDVGCEVYFLTDEDIL